AGEGGAGQGDGDANQGDGGADPGDGGASQGDAGSNQGNSGGAQGNGGGSQGGGGVKQSDATYAYNSVTEANGTLILNFEQGQTIDLSGIDANTGRAGDQAFTLLDAGADLTGAAGELSVNWHTDSLGRELTVIEGNVDGV